MRFREFANDDDRFVLKLYALLKNLRGRASSKNSPAEFNWNAIDKLYPDFSIDYEVFDKIYQSNQTMFEPIVHDYSGDGITLKVPGAPEADEPGKDRETSQDKVDDIAASAAEKNLD